MKINPAQVLAYALIEDFDEVAVVGRKGDDILVAVSHEGGYKLLELGQEEVFNLSTEAEDPLTASEESSTDIPPE